MTTKTTFNFAERRGFNLVELPVNDYDDRQKSLALWVFNDDNDCEPDVIYIQNTDGSYTFFDAYVPSAVREELPATINNELHMREVINFISCTL